MMIQVVQYFILGAIIILPSISSGESFFMEDFEAGSNPFDFTIHNDFQSISALVMTGEQLDVGGNRNSVWKSPVHNYIRECAIC